MMLIGRRLSGGSTAENCGGAITPTTLKEPLLGAGQQDHDGDLNLITNTDYYTATQTQQSTLP